MKGHRLFYLIAGISTAVFLLLQLYDPALIRDHLESKTYDLRLQLRNRLNPPVTRSDIVIVEIDEKSLAEVGRWPWSRATMAQLVRAISADRPKTVGIDIMFSEREGDGPDGELARAIADAGNVVLATAFLVADKGVGKVGEPPDYLWDSSFMEVKAVPGIPWKQWAVKPVQVLPPIEEIARGATLGHVTTHPDLDGVLRWEILYVNFGDDCYPALPLQVARVARGLPMSALVLYPGSSIHLGDAQIATDLSGRVLVNYYGREGSFRTLSAADVLAGRIPSATLKDAIVLIGTSALATYDQKITPLSANMPGVEKNASVIQNILSDGFISHSPGVVELAVILVTGILLIVLLPRLNAKQGVVVGFGLMGLYLLLTCYLLSSRNVWLNLLYPATNMFVILTTETVNKLFTEERKAREIRRMFSSYVSPKIVETLINHPERLALGGQRKVATILFSDMIGFTTLSEKLPPEQVVEMLNEYYKEMAGIIFKWDGTLDKFVGDEIMALWGAPLDQPNHAELAFRCALHMSDRLDRLREEWRAQGKSIVDCGIGINTGEVLIGNVGLEGMKMDYTAIGNHVNIAARLEKATRSYGTRILISEETLNEFRPLIESGRIGHVELTFHGGIKVKGKDEEVKIYAVRSLPGDRQSLFLQGSGAIKLEEE